MALGEVRRASPDDAAAIATIYNGYVRDTDLTFTTRLSGVADIAEAITAGAPYWVAARDGTIAGFARYGAFRPGPGYRYSFEVSLYTAPGQSGRGLGRAMLRALEAGARGDAGQALIAAIAGANTPAQAFFAAQGYVERGRLPAVGWKSDRWHDLVLMQKSLSDAAEDR